MGTQGSLSGDLMWFELQLTQNQHCYLFKAQYIDQLSYICLGYFVVVVSSCHNCGTMNYSLCLEILAAADENSRLGHIYGVGGGGGGGTGVRGGLARGEGTLEYWTLG
jgi:hypothetical protein